MESVATSRKVWRKLVKKLRRKRIRQQKAKERKILELHPEVTDDELPDNEEEEAQRLQRHLEWLKVEEDAQKKWIEKEQARNRTEEELRKTQELIRKEWESATRQKLEEKRAKEAKLAELNQKVENFIEKGGSIPEELLVLKESNPGKAACPFFSKVAACRFGPSCSRNHVVPGIATTILIPNCYTHFNLSQNKSTEYGTDISLEFDDTEMNRDFREFFADFVSELQILGQLKVVQVCRNGENHLRGNLYAEYVDERGALAAARALNARWYGGRQLSVSFASVPDWQAAVCGDFHRGRCPKGDQCNFLHTFKNPRGQFIPRRKTLEHLSARSWRWSESPERDCRSRETRHSRDRSTSRKEDSSSKRSCRSRSRSRESKRERLRDKSNMDSRRNETETSKRDRYRNRHRSRSRNRDSKSRSRHK